MINVMRVGASASAHLVVLHLHEDKEEPNNFRLFGTDQYLIIFGHDVLKDLSSSGLIQKIIVEGRKPTARCVIDKKR